MSDLPIDSMRRRPRSSSSRNYKNIQLHACLDEAKLYQDRVVHHFSQSKFENHTLQSAERIYEKGIRLNPTRSASAFKRSSSDFEKLTNTETRSMVRTASKLQRNPQQLFGAFEEKTLKITQIKYGFDDGQAEKQMLKQKIEELKKVIVIEKNRKAKVSLNNSKLMNANVLSNYQISKLNEESRRNNILIKEVEDDVNVLIKDNNDLQSKNRQKDFEIQELYQQNNRHQDFITKTRRGLFEQRKNLEELKQAQTISYKEMMNNYMLLNQRKEQKALLLNSIEIDVANNS